MTRPDRSDATADPVDPWAPGGAMASVPPSSTTSVRLSFDAAETTSAPPPATGRRWLLGGAAALAAGIVITVVVTAGSSRGESQPASPGIGEIGVASQPAELPDTLAPSPTPAQQLELARETREFVIDIAPELAGIDPTEIVALRGDNELFEVSLPSGRVRATTIGFDTQRAQLAVNGGGAVVWPTAEGGALAIGTSGDVAWFGELIDAVSWAPGADEMYFWTHAATTDGPAVQQVVLDLQTIEAQPAPWADVAAGPEPFVDFDGALLRADAGGTYRLGALGTERLSTGDVVASGSNHLLLRECDAARSCTLVTLASDGARTEWTIDLPAEITPLEIGGLSPGGDALLVHTDRIAPDAARSLWVLELGDGTVQPLRTPAAEVIGAWDTTGAGVFVADPALLYIDRFTATAVVVADDLVGLRDVAVRRPVATPICEVLAIALPRFHEMEVDGDDNTTTAPPSEVLDRIVAFAPDDLGAQVAALITFVSGFVSPEIADSQTVANWPANVRAGLDALDSYAAAECPLI